jgi:protein-disulfide isomerase
MKYFFAVCRLPILSLVLSSLFLGSFPVQAGTQFMPNRLESDPLGRLSSGTKIDPLSEDSAPAEQILLAQKTKVSPQLEKQILEVIRRNPAVILEVLQKYAIEQQQKDQKAQAEKLKQLRTNTKAMIGDSPTMGAIDRKIVMVEFSDFQCPFCATANQNLKQFMAKNKDKVTLVYKYFPLTQIHPEALPAARAAWAANRQGKFWEYHEALFANQSKLGETFYLETATKLKLDLNKFNADRQTADAAIVKDFKLGRDLGVDGTPTFIMNGEIISGAATLADFEKALARVRGKLKVYS